jgi:hypothetical protein
MPGKKTESGVGVRSHLPTSNHASPDISPDFPTNTDQKNAALHPNGYNLANVPIAAKMLSNNQRNNPNGSTGKLPIQAKLTIGKPDNKYEQEADRVSKQVVNQIDFSKKQKKNKETQQFSKQLSQDYSFAGRTMRILPPPESSKIATSLHTPMDLEKTIQESWNRGQKLPVNVQKTMNDSFGSDFSQVKIHTNEVSDQMNRSIQSIAFTLRNNIFFRRGHYSPNGQDQTLLAHELSHVIQQNGETNQQLPPNLGKTQPCQIIRRFASPTTPQGEQAVYNFAKNGEYKKALHKIIQVYALKQQMKFSIDRTDDYTSLKKYGVEASATDTHFGVTVGGIALNRQNPKIPKEPTIFIHDKWIKEWLINDRRIGSLINVIEHEIKHAEQRNKKEFLNVQDDGATEFEAYTQEIINTYLKIQQAKKGVKHSLPRQYEIIEAYDKAKEEYDNNITKDKRYKYKNRLLSVEKKMSEINSYLGQHVSSEKDEVAFNKIFEEYMKWKDTSLSKDNITIQDDHVKQMGDYYQRAAVAYGYINISEKQEKSLIEKRFSEIEGMKTTLAIRRGHLYKGRTQKTPQNSTNPSNGLLQPPPKKVIDKPDLNAPTNNISNSSSAQQITSVTNSVAINNEDIDWVNFDYTNPTKEDTDWANFDYINPTKQDTDWANFDKLNLTKQDKEDI